MNTKDILERFDRMREKKSIHTGVWNQVAEYILTNKRFYFTDHHSSDTTRRLDSNEHLYDSEAIYSHSTLSNALVGILWFSNAKNFEIKPSEMLGDLDKEEKDFFDMFDERVNDAFMDVNADFAISLYEYMQEVVGLGTAGLGVYEGEDSVLKFHPYGLDLITISGSVHEKIDAIYIYRDFKISTLVDMYGLENLSENVRNRYSSNPEEEGENIPVLIAYEKRHDKRKGGNKAMDYGSYHIEYESQHLLKESGFHELPIKIGRFAKAHDNLYGTCPSIRALPEIRQINILVAQLEESREAILKPAHGYYADLIGGKGQLDTSPGAKTPFRYDRMLGGREPIFPLNTIGQPFDGEKQLARLSKSIQRFFLLDIILGPQDRKERTLGEVQVDLHKQSAVLSGTIIRQLNEVLFPVIARAVGIVSKRERFMYPARVAELSASGKSFYKIKLLSPAARIQRAEELQGSMKTLEVLAALENFYPIGKDIIDIDKTIKNIAEISGAPDKILKGLGEVDEIRKQRAADVTEEREKASALAVADILQKTGGSRKEGQG